MTTQSIREVFPEYVRKVNALARARCDEANRAGRRVFTAHHIDYPDVMLRYYWDRDYTPESALAEIAQDTRS